LAQQNLKKIPPFLGISAEYAESSPDTNPRLNMAARTGGRRTGPALHALNHCSDEGERGTVL
jgi:hypothetical protein